MPSGNTQPAQGGITGFLAKAPDPLHISNGGGGLDPFNLMGSPAPADPGPSSLTGLGIRPQFYDPNSFVARPGGSGPWNQIAARTAGPMYDPRMLKPPSMGMGSMSGIGTGGFMPGMPMRPNGPEPADPNMASIRAMLQQFRQQNPPPPGYSPMVKKGIGIDRGRG